MAESSKNIYIPSCGDKHCLQWLQKVHDGLLKFPLTCRIDHPIYGKYKSWFEKYFGECDFIIIHYCHLLWKKIHKLTEFFQEQHGKIILLKIASHECGSSADEHVQKLLDDFYEEMDCAQHIEKYKDLEIFVKKVIQALDLSYPPENVEANNEEYNISGSGVSMHSSTQYDSMYYSGTSSEYSPYDPCVSEGQEAISRNFDKYFDIFGSADDAVHVRSCDVQQNCSWTFQYDYPQDLVDQLDGSIGDGIQNSNVILLKFLPLLYMEKKALELSTITLCKWTILKERALVLLEFLLWESWADDCVYRGELDVKFLIDVCSPLTKALHNLKEEYRKSKKDKFLNLIKHISHISLMLWSAIIMSPKNNEQETSTVEQFFKGQRDQLLDSPSLEDSSQKNLEIFLKFAYGENHCEVKDKAEKFLKHFDEPSHKYTPQKLLKESLHVQFIVLSELVKKVFSLSKDPLKFLTEYLKPTKSIMGRRLMASKDRKPPMACVTMVFQGLTLFLSHGVRKKAHMDVKKICEETMNVIKVAAERDLPNEIGRSILSLLFDARSFIRQVIIEIFKRRQSYRENLLLYSVNVIEQLLFPLMKKSAKIPQEEKSNKKLKANLFQEKVSTESSEWKVLNIKYAEMPAQLFVCSVHEMNHFRSNKTQFKKQTDLHFTEILNLTKLRHENIIQMFAFQTAKMPQFYILEDCQQRLQVMLKNAQENQKFFKPDFLCKLLLDAFKGLRYCHDRALIHRNLTADSLCVVNMQSVKLCSFGLCMKEAKHGIAIELNSTTIPLRWSAPESIFDGEFSKQSDIWMVGHLMYEVLTHGLLPYSTFISSDDEFLVSMQSRELNLHKEQCLNEKMFDLITMCTEYDLQRRPSIEEVYTLTEESYHSDFVATQEKVNYPVIDDNNEQSSTVFTKGIPLRFLGMKSKAASKSRNMSTESAEESLQSKDVTYHVNVCHRLSSNTKACIHRKELQDILPSIELYRAPNGTDSLSCKIPPQAKSFYELSGTRLLGNDVNSYLRLIIKVAEKLSVLHSRSWVIGDLSPSTVFIDPTTRKPYIASLSCLKYVDQRMFPSQESKDEGVNLPRDRQSSAAPEVTQHGKFSPASDVFCFGNFMWVLLTAFDNYYTYNAMQIKPFGYMAQKKILHALMTGKWEENNPKPNCCPPDLYRLIVQCVSMKEKERPSMTQIIEYLKSLCRADIDVVVDNPSLYSGGSITSTSRFKNFLISSFLKPKEKQNLKEDNPSISSDFDISVAPYEQFIENPYELIDDDSIVGYRQFSPNALTFNNESSFSSSDSFTMSDSF